MDMHPCPAGSPLPVPGSPSTNRRAQLVKGQRPSAVTPSPSPAVLGPIPPEATKGSSPPPSQSPSATITSPPAASRRSTSPSHSSGGRTHAAALPCNLPRGHTVIFVAQQKMMSPDAWTGCHLHMTCMRGTAVAVPPPPFGGLHRTDLVISRPATPSPSLTPLGCTLLPNIPVSPHAPNHKCSWWHRHVYVRGNGRVAVCFRLQQWPRRLADCTGQTQC